MSSTYDSYTSCPRISRARGTAVLISTNPSLAVPNYRHKNPQSGKLVLVVFSCLGKWVLLTVWVPFADDRPKGNLMRFCLRQTTTNSPYFSFWALFQSLRGPFASFPGFWATRLLYAELFE